MTAGDTAAAAPLWAWRHPLARGVAGRCIGRCDVPADPRRARRLARRIATTARRESLPRVVVTSPLQRAACVGRLLAARGWRHHIDPALAEADFGRWDGRRWDAIGAAAVAAWCTAFAHHAPGGGEAVAALLARAARWAPPPGCACVVGHAGWLSARAWVAAHPGGAYPGASDWPAPLAHGQATRIAAQPLPWAGR